MRKLILAFVVLVGTALVCFAQRHNLLIDSFEVMISGGPEGTVDFGAGNGSSIKVTAATDIAHEGVQALKVTFDAASGGYMWIARGFNLDARNAGWLVKPENIDWNQYDAVSFYMFGSDAKTKVAFDIKDNGGEIWRYLLEDNFTGWKQVICPFNEFFARTDWQPDAAKTNAALNFPLQSYQFEPLPPAKGTFYFDAVELIKTGE